MIVFANLNFWSNRQAKRMLDAAESAFSPCTKVSSKEEAKACLDKFHKLEMEDASRKVELYQKLKDGGLYFSNSEYLGSRSCLDIDLLQLWFNASDGEWDQTPHSMYGALTHQPPVITPCASKAYKKWDSILSLSTGFDTADMPIARHVLLVSCITVHCLLNKLKLDY